MFRSSLSILFNSGLLLATTLAVLPAQLHAQPATPPPVAKPTAQPIVENQPQPAVATPKLQPSPNIVVPAKPDPQPVDRSKLEPELLSIGKNSATPGKPVTNDNSLPTAKPAVAASNNTQPPIAVVVNLVLKLKEKKVYVYKGDKLVTKYPVAIGKKGWETPTGEWQVMEKIVNPAWTSFKTGEVLAPGKENPLGSRWIGFWTDGQDVIGFHGTPNVKSIGTAASHGCVRMLNRDVKALFPLVKVGTTVKVVDE